MMDTKATGSPSPETCDGPNDTGDSETNQQTREHLWNQFKDYFEQSLLGQSEDTAIRDAVWGAAFTAAGKLIELQPEPYACTKSKGLGRKIDSIGTRLDVVRQGLVKDINGLDKHLSILYHQSRKHDRQEKDKDSKRGRQNHVIEGRIAKLKKETRASLKRSVAAAASPETTQHSLPISTIVTEAHVNEAVDTTFAQRIRELEQRVNMLMDQNEKLAKQVQDLASRSK